MKVSKMAERPNIVGPEYIAELLGCEVSSIKVDVNRRPESLPPRLLIPGRARLMWVEEDVLDWVNSFRPKKPEEKKKVGRPSLYALQQRANGTSDVAE